MSKSKPLIDVSQDFLILPYRDGVKLIDPHQQPKLNSFIPKSIADIFKFDFNIYFLNCGSSVQNANTTMLNMFDLTLKKCINKTALELMGEKTAPQFFAHDNQVIHSQKMKIFEEPVNIVKNISQLEYASVKFPWYNHDNVVIGIFGCSTIIDSYSISSFVKLFKFIEIAVAKNQKFQSESSSTKSLPGLVIANIYLTKREVEILSFLLRGKTAKQIAKHFLLSPRTVEYHLENIKLKCKAQSKSELIDFAFANQLQYLTLD